MTIEELWEDIHIWQVKTFGDNDTLDGKFSHLVEELDEILENPRCKEEWADAFILLIGSCRAQGIKFKQIVKAINNKMQINKSRKWGIPNELGIIKSIKNE